jgi:glycerophosphoryl diester phosphodiesterase
MSAQRPRALPPRHHALQAWLRKPKHPPLVLGHRGARERAAENTLAAFDLALDEGAAGVELDVRLALDDEIVVIHDLSLERVTGGRDRRRVERTSSAELAGVDVGGGEGVPRLAQVFDWAAKRSALVNVELKHDGRRTRELVPRVVALVRSRPNLEGKVLLSCFHPSVVRRLATLAPELPVAWLVHRRQAVLRDAPGWKMLGAVGVHPEHVLVTASRVARWHRGGALVNVWTVNDPAAARRLAALGVDTIISDVPGKILAALG